MSKGECCYSGFGERVCQFITGKSSVTGTCWKLKSYTGEEREPERSKISQDFGWRNVGAVERRARAD